MIVFGAITKNELIGKRVGIIKKPLNGPYIYRNRECIIGDVIKAALVPGRTRKKNGFFDFNDGQIILRTAHSSGVPTTTAVIDSHVEAIFVDKKWYHLTQKKNEWKIKGSKGNIYTVTYNAGTYKCTCPGFKYRKTCKHIQEVINEE